MSRQPGWWGVRGPLATNRALGFFGVGLLVPAVIACLVLGGHGPRVHHTALLIVALGIGLAACAGPNDLVARIAPYLPTAQTGGGAGIRVRSGVPLSTRLADTFLAYVLIVPGEVAIGLTSARWLAWVWITGAGLIIAAALWRAWGTPGTE